MLNPNAPPAPPRRLVLRGLAGLAGLGALAACDVRLESDAPAIPVLPRQEGVDERLLLDLAGAVITVGELAASAPSSGPSERPAAAGVATACAAQGKALAAALAVDGVPAAVIAAATSAPTGAGFTAGTSAVPSAVPSAEPSAHVVSLEELWAAQAHVVSARVAEPATTSVAVAHRALVASVLTYHAASSSLGAAPPRWPSQSVPSAAAAIALDRIRAARYGLTVAAAHVAGAAQNQLMGLDAALHRIEARLREQAGGAAGAAPPAYELPVVVTNAASATALVTTVVANLRSGVLAPLGALQPASPGLAAVIRHACEVLVMTEPWSGPLVPLPGLQV